MSKYSLGESFRYPSEVFVNGQHMGRSLSQSHAFNPGFACVGYLTMLVRDGGSQKVSFHKLPSMSSGPFRTLPAGQNVAMPEAEYSVYFGDQVCPPSLRCLLISGFEFKIAPSRFIVTVCIPPLHV